MEEKQGQIFEMKIVVDTNILFSALLSPSGKISDFLQTNALLWTGDFKLVDGLLKSGYENCVKTEFLTEFRDNTDKF